jgi:hypothetical protein
VSREAKLTEKTFQEVPLHRVECLLEIHFQQATGRRAFPTILAEEFLDQIYVVTHMPPPQESILHGADNIMKS